MYIQLVNRLTSPLSPTSWNPAGVLMGKIAVDGGAANFAFVPEGMFIFNEQRLFRVSLKAQGRTVARDFGLDRPEYSYRR